MTVWVVAFTFDVFCTNPGVSVLSLHSAERLAWNRALQEGFERSMPVMSVESPDSLGMLDDGKIIVYPMTVEEA